MRPSPMRAIAPTPPARLPESGSICWFRPDEDLSDDLVLAGETARRVGVLASELPHTEEFLRRGVDPSTRILFSGPSGTGKTLAARWLGWTLKLPVAVIDVSAVVGSHLGETSNNLAACFKSAGAVPAILFLDEIDAICSRREDMSGGQAGSAELARATTTFLQQMDWLPPSRIVVAATNFPENLDSALRRRLTTEIVFGYPDAPARARMLERWLSRAGVSAEMRASLVESTEGLSGADLRSRAMAMGREAVMESIRSAPPPPPPKKPREHAQALLLSLERIGEKR